VPNARDRRTDATHRDARLGSRFAGRYRIVERVGFGGMATVYGAVHEATSGEVALKIMAASLGSEERARFEREVRATARLSSAHIVRVHDGGVEPSSGVPYLVLERLRGEDLAAVVRRTGALDTITALKIAAQAATGLMAAHAAGIVHRDVKPSNVFLAREHDRVTVKILDFGIAKLDGCGDPELTSLGSVLGSPFYMSPEQTRETRDVDARTDIWSLGVVLYQMLAGQVPFAGPSIVDVIWAISTDTFRPLDEVAPWVDERICKIVERAMKREPSQRFRSMAEMLRDMLVILEGDRAIAVDAVYPAPLDSGVRFTPSSSAERLAQSESLLKSSVPADWGEPIRESTPRRATQRMIEVRSPRQTTSPLPSSTVRRRPAVTCANEAAPPAPSAPRALALTPAAKVALGLCALLLVLGVFLAYPLL
jgi:serine/threonine-protein kinase